MLNSVVIENIEALRRQQGIDDVQLREEIRRLAIGDFVNLTLQTGPAMMVQETLAVRITRIRGRVFHGELAGQPTLVGLAQLQVGAPFSFTATHIHSLPKRQFSHEQ